MSGLEDLIREIYRRSIWKVLGIYLGGSWLVLEAIGGISETAGLPGWLAPFALVLLLIGLPVVAATAFIQEGLGTAADGDPSGSGAAGGTGEPMDASGLAATPPRAGAQRIFTWRNAILGGVLAFAGLGVIAVLAVATDLWPSGRDAESTSTAGASRASSVAVLPFDNIGGQEDMAFLSEGITEEITAQLARVPDLHVISRTSAEAVSGSNLTTPQIADTLGVQHILEGSVQVFGDQIRVTAQLIHAETDNHLWADSYNGPLAELFSLQEDIAIRVTSALTTVVGGPRPTSAASRTEEPVAYEAYLTGKSQLHTRTATGLLAAIRSFERSVVLDSTYALAYAGLASSYGLSITYGHPDLDGYQLYGRALAMANRAIELDRSAAEAYATRGYLRTKAFGPPEEVAADFLRALELTPNSADAHGWYAHYLVREEQHEEALAEATIAIEIDPLAPGRRVGFALDAIAARRYDLVVRETQRALALESTLAVPRFLEAIASLLDGRPDDCLDGLRDSYPGLRAMCRHSRGDVAGAMQTVDSLKSSLGETSVPSSHAEMVSYRDIATFYAWIGDVDQALTWLERAFTWSHNAVEFRVMASGVFDGVREVPRFRSGLERIHGGMRERFAQEEAALGSP